MEIVLCVLFILNKEIIMFFVIFFFFFVFVFIIIFVPSIILTIISKVLAFFGFAPKEKRYYENEAPRKNERHERSSKKSKKIFDKDEGEYVDFEEIE